MNVSRTEKHERLKSKILHASASLFLKNGYSQTTVKDIAARAGIKESTMLYTIKSKENILSELVKYVLENQFAATKRLLQGVTEDKVLFYAAETTLQLHITESSEHIRDLYSAAYSMPATTEIIQHTITGKLEDIFSEHLPHLQTKDFYELEIASGGIMRGFITVPCDMYFTMERKINRFLETTFLLYRVPDEKIREAIEFISQFDYDTIANDVINSMLVNLDEQI